MKWVLDKCAEYLGFLVKQSTFIHASMHFKVSISIDAYELIAMFRPFNRSNASQCACNMKERKHEDTTKESPWSMYKYNVDVPSVCISSLMYTESWRCIGWIPKEVVFPAAWSHSTLTWLGLYAQGQAFSMNHLVDQAMSTLEIPRTFVKRDKYVISLATSVHVMRTLLFIIFVHDQRCFEQACRRKDEMV